MVITSARPEWFVQLSSSSVFSLVVPHLPLILASALFLCSCLPMSSSWGLKLLPSQLPEMMVSVSGYRALESEIFLFAP